MRLSGARRGALLLALAVVYLSTSGQFVRRRAININVGDDWQTAVDAAGVGQRFIIKTGTHRQQSVNPKNGQAFVGETGAVMSGARLLHASTDATLGSFTTSGSFWRIGSQTQAPGARDNANHCQSIVNGYDADFLACSKREELFRDGVRVLNVETFGELGAGKWYFDYATDFIYVGDNPTSHTIETSITTTAFNPTANDVVIQNLSVQMYASQAQYGAINAENTSGWIISGNAIKLNHGGGIRIGHTMRVSRNVVTYNGEIGIVGVGTDVLVDWNEIAFNNDAHWDQGWEGGGTKFVLTIRLIVRDNYAHDNHGPGIWSDIDNIYTLYERNLCEDNDRNGIYHEISNDAIIRYNIVRRNGFEFPDWGFGAGIGVAGSPNVEVYNNIVEDNADGIMALQQARGSGTYGAHETTNLYVHNNTIKMPTTSGWTGLVQDVGDTTYFTSRNNRFQNNTYQLQSNTNYFSWMNGDKQSFATWQGLSQDTGGSASTY